MNEEQSRRERLKEILHDSERLSRYYTRSSQHALYWHRVWLSAILFATFALGLIPAIPNKFWVNVFSFGSLSVIAISSVVMIIWDFSHRAGVYRVIGEQCQDIARACVQLWYTKPLPEYTEIMITEFETRITNVTKEDTKTNEKLNLECDEEAEHSVARLQKATGW